MSNPALKPSVSSSPCSSVNFEELLHTLDKEFENAPPSLVERFRFSFDGLDFDVRRIVHLKGHRFLVNATMGYMPFSIESSERREAIKTIIAASRVLPSVHFVVDTTSKISAGAMFDITHIVSPDFIFYPLTLFLQEARPFIQLIGKHLFAPTLVPKADASLETAKTH